MGDAAIHALAGAAGGCVSMVSVVQALSVRFDWHELKWLQALT